MAKYTMLLRTVCNYYTRAEVENWFKSYKLEDYLLPNQIKVIKDANLWNKDKLAKKIVDHYFFREIGFETPSLFKHYVLISMEELMQERLPLIYTYSIEYDPLINVDFKETFERDVSGTGNSSSEGNSKSNSNSSSGNLSINNNTPQTRIQKQDLNSGFYASSVSQSDSTTKITDSTSTNNNQNSSSESKESYTRHQIGNSGALTTTQSLIQQFRKNILALDKDIIENLNDLFMCLY